MDLYPHRLLLWLCALLIQGLLTQAGSKCQLPRAWKGRWWQSSLGDVIIRDYSINRKGVCTEHQRDYYLLYNKNNDCYQCLLIIEEQRNIIQYKESYCSDYNTLHQICRSIQVESPLYTLVREPSARIRCPFHEAYYFNYNDHTTGFCDNPLSYAKPCAGQHQYKLHFSHCVPQAVYNGVDAELECLATWKAGSDLYLYGKFSGPSIRNKDDAYRCFIYKMIGSRLHMAMSIDPTCRGLRGAHDGPIIFTFTKDLRAWPSPSCQFPAWLHGKQWRDLEGQHSYTLENDGSSLYANFRKKATSKPQPKIEFRCVERVDVPDAQPTIVIYSFSTHRCVSKYQCLKIVRKTDGVFELHQGVLAEYDGNGRCLSDSEYTSSQIILLTTAQPIPCPSPSYYTITPSSDCLMHLDVGCASNSSMNLLSNCSQLNAVFHIDCMAYWHGQGKTYIVGRNLEHNSRLYNCFSFRERSAGMEFGLDRTCNAGIEAIHTYNFKHFVAPFGHCDSIVRPTLSTPTVTSRTTPTTTITPSTPPDVIIVEGSGGGAPTVGTRQAAGVDDEDYSDEEGSTVDPTEEDAFRVIFGSDSDRDGTFERDPYREGGTRGVYPYSPAHTDDAGGDSRVSLDSPGSNTDDFYEYSDSSSSLSSSSSSDHGRMSEDTQEGLYNGCPSPRSPLLLTALTILAHSVR